MPRFINPKFVAVMVTLTSSISASAQNVTWRNFTTAPQMRQLILENTKSPLNSYRILKRARERKLGVKANQVYYGLIKEKPSDPYLQAAYAWSHFLAVGPISPHYFNPSPPKEVAELRAFKTTAVDFRKKALAAKPENPVILVETGVQKYYEASHAKEQQQAIMLVRQAVSLAPNWADARVWLGDMLLQYWPNDLPRKKELSNEALNCYRKAQKLEPQLKNSLLLKYSAAFEYVGQYQKAVQYWDAHIKVHPYYRKDARDIRRRARLVKMASKQGGAIKN